MGDTWIKSTYSGYNGNCVQVAAARPAAILVRDSKIGESSPVLEFPAADWRRFTAALKARPFVP